MASASIADRTRDRSALASREYYDSMEARRTRNPPSARARLRLDWFVSDTVRDQPEQKRRQYSLTAFSRFRNAPIFEPLLAPARYKGSGSTKARCTPPM